MCDILFVSRQIKLARSQRSEGGASHKVAKINHRGLADCRQETGSSKAGLGEDFGRFWFSYFLEEGTEEVEGNRWWLF